MQQIHFYSRTDMQNIMPIIHQRPPFCGRRKTQRERMQKRRAETFRLVLHVAIPLCSYVVVPLFHHIRM